MSFSNRCFPTKAVAVWTQTDDPGHIWYEETHTSATLNFECSSLNKRLAWYSRRIVGSYFKFSEDWSAIKAFDLSTGKGDPMFIVQGTK
jgi:hypothetical protein